LSAAIHSAGSIPLPLKEVVKPTKELMLHSSPFCVNGELPKLLTSYVNISLFAYMKFGEFLSGLKDN